MMHSLLQQADENFSQPPIEVEVMELMSKRILDAKFFDFIRASNGGFFFDRSLQVYGICKGPSYHSISLVNSIISHEYGKLAEGFTFFGQDVLGNQFAFSDKGVVMFNLETADIEVLAKDFDNWIQVVFGDLDYLTGRNLLKEWSKNNRLGYDQRLCAKKPFLVGGEYNTENLYAQFFPTYLSSNANIAKQVHDLPDGAKIVIRITE